MMPEGPGRDSPRPGPEGPREPGGPPAGRRVPSGTLPSGNGSGDNAPGGNRPGGDRGGGTGPGGTGGAPVTSGAPGKGATGPGGDPGGEPVPDLTPAQRRAVTGAEPSTGRLTARSSTCAALAAKGLAVRHGRSGHFSHYLSPHGRSVRDRLASAPGPSAKAPGPGGHGSPSTGQDGSPAPGGAAPPDDGRFRASTGEETAGGPAAAAPAPGTGGAPGGRTGRAEHTERTEQSERTGGTGRADHPPQPERGRGAGQNHRPEQSGQPRRADRDRPDAAGAGRAAEVASAWSGLLEIRRFSNDGDTTVPAPWERTRMVHAVALALESAGAPPSAVDRPGGRAVREGYRVTESDQPGAVRVDWLVPARPGSAGDPTAREPLERCSRTLGVRGWQPTRHTDRWGRWFLLVSARRG